jgi:CheY-like chemotaxis protein
MMITIFLTEDDEDDRAFFEEALKELNTEIELKSLTDGEALMTSLSEVTSEPPPPHLIFLDLNMPRKDGFECLAEIKNNPHLKKIPVVVISTSTNPADIDRTYTLGANAYIAKPNKLKDLKKVVESALGLKLWMTQLSLPKNQYVLSAQC